MLATVTSPITRGNKREREQFLLKRLTFPCAVTIAVCFFGWSCSKNEPESAVGASPSTSVSVAPVNADDYKIGTTISFGKSGQAAHFKVSGWSEPEDQHTWMQGTAAFLSFSGLPSSTPLRLRMTIGALTKAPELPTQPVEVYANGEKIAGWQVSDNAEFTTMLPVSTMKGGTDLKLELRAPKATSPKALGVNSDPRILGIRCFDLTIDKA